MNRLTIGRLANESRICAYTHTLNANLPKVSIKCDRVCGSGQKKVSVKRSYRGSKRLKRTLKHKEWCQIYIESQFIFIVVQNDNGDEIYDKIANNPVTCQPNQTQTEMNQVGTMVRGATATSTRITGARIYCFYWHLLQFGVVFSHRSHNLCFRLFYLNFSINFTRALKLRCEKQSKINRAPMQHEAWMMKKKTVNKL